MVRVNGPMFSLAASGSLANTIVFSQWKGRPYVRERVVPSNPKSGGQVGRRAMFTFLTQEWAGIAAGPKATWDTLADQDTISAFNAYIKFNMGTWHNYLPPSQAIDPPRIDTASDNVLTAAVWEENRIKLTLAGTTLNDAWGINIYATTGTGFTPAVGNTIITAADLTFASHDIFWTPPSVTTWYFNSQTFSDEGLLTAAGGEVNAVP